MKLTGIYLITNLINGKMYVGLSVDIPKRWNKHTKTSKNKSRAIKNALNKYGVDNFNFKMIHQCSKKRLGELEKFYIKKLNTMSPNGYNLTSGGEHPEWSQESRDKLSVSLTGRVVSNECCQNISKAQKESEKTERHIIALADMKRGVPLTPEHRNNLKRTLEQREKMSRERIAKEKKHTIETKEKMSQSSPNKKKVLQYTMTDVFVKEWSSGAEIKRELNISVSNACRGEKNRKQAGGFKWKYADEKNVE